MKINKQSRKFNEQGALNLGQTFNKCALKQYQSVDFTDQTIIGFKLITLVTALALGLIGKPYLAHAEETAVISNIHALAEFYAQGSNDVLAQDHWTRVEFSGAYIDPVVVVEGSSANENHAYVVGICNVDTMGFEISLKNCSNSASNPVQEDVNYTVIERSQLPATEDAKAEIRQQFSWGEYTTTVANTTTS
ncbi:MAG: hypothetical protein WAW61_16765 [Methylococcaceae bacterium]